jgi:hypothetical protein
VWRNVIVGTLLPGLDTFAAHVAVPWPPDPEGWEPELSLVWIGPPAPELATSFIHAGRVRVTLDPPLLEAWRRAGSRGSGFKREGVELLLTDPRGAWLQGFDRGPSDRRAGLTLQLESTPETPSREYRLDVQQWESGELVGGVSCEIRVGAAARERAPGGGS